MVGLDADEARNTVREHYGKVARANGQGGCCAPGACGSGPATSARLGYSAAELASVAEGADLGLGCGNPQGIAALRSGETVLDLGSGAGFDALLAAHRVGPTGRVIGVDMTPEMLRKARENADRAGVSHVEFRLGEIEHLPLTDSTVDVILSNCVINLCPNKAAVFQEAFRVLRPGGRLAISDVVATAAIPERLHTNDAALTACVSGAAPIHDLRRLLCGAGFTDIDIKLSPESRAFIQDWLPATGIEDVLSAATIRATKPSAARACCGPACCDAGAVAE